MNATELLTRYAAGERDFTGVKLPGVRLIDKVLRGIILKEADLSDGCFDWTNLYDADLSYADLRGARLGEAVLQAANLQGADLSDAVFGQTPLAKANLSHAKLRRAILTETSFDEANLSYTDFTGAIDFELGRCKGAIFCETLMPDGTVRNERI
jgi:uncharacterized protein YjbI with pentapeptide repeats